MRKLKKGFTLIELLISISLILIVMGGIFTFFISTYKANNSVNDEIELQSQGEKAINFMMDNIIEAKGIESVIDTKDADVTEQSAPTDIKKLVVSKIDSTYNIFEIKNDALYYSNSNDVNSDAVNMISNFIYSVQISSLKDADLKSAEGIRINIYLKKKDMTKTITNEVYFRNK